MTPSWQKVRQRLRPFVPVLVADAVKSRRVLLRLGRSRKDALRLALRPETLLHLEQANLFGLPIAALRRPCVVVDVGAYRGHWSQTVLDLLVPDRLVTVEPNPESFAILQKRFGEDPKVSLRQMAVGPEPGRATLHVMKAANFTSLLEPLASTSEMYDDVSQVREVDVEVQTLDTLLSDVGEIAFLKIDVQGLEAGVLAGAADVLARTAAVQLEASFVPHYRGDMLFCDLAKNMDERGFVLWHLGNAFQHESSRTMWADAIFLRRDLVPSATA